MSAATPVNYVICSGWLMKRGGFVTSWKRRYFVLRNDRYLCYFSCEIGAGTPLSTIEKSLLGTIALGDALAVVESTAPNLDDPQTVFDIVTPNRTYVCKASAVESKNKWVEALRAMITPIPEFPFSKQGYLYKKAKYKWTRHYLAVGAHCVYQFEDELHCAAFQRIAGHSGKIFSLAMEWYCQAAISLMSTQCEPSPPSHDCDGMFNTFVITSPSRCQIWLSASSQKETRRWSEAINKEILHRRDDC
ncbi:PH domain-containing protein [Plasmodiophora brassicae]|uniref:PH domain-containing protein n=1 Tax=Plasmodiophora brassicae TaxID=37360 RepID=A0A0G4J252_PLABS|nr:hypothetical protein PBRA_008635 [Plasmodiophora brassicae]SPQ98509.1 unnamed protein product [Plasmodiophora brassicae]